MSKIDYKIGSSKLEDFYRWINERHRIYLKRLADKPKPWTDDEIFMDFKFTNAFRELDRGTVALRKMLADACKYLQSAYDRGILETIFEEELILFNVIWYRLFNLEEHARELGFVTDYKPLERYIRQRQKRGKRIFTSAHMTTGRPGELKSESYLQACKEAWDAREDLAQWLMPERTMESMLKKILPLYMVGPFVAYEIICDLRFTPLMDDAPDKMTWANVGPGAKRGLERLGLVQVRGETTWLDNMVWLLHPDQALMYFEPHVAKHYSGTACPPFELREIEHSLCEFDKYERVRLGQGKPRSKYNGRS